MQVPPRFSAIKVDGERAYDLARERREGRARAAAGLHREPRARRNAGCRRRAVFEAELRQGHVRARPRPRHGPRSGCSGHVIALRRTRVGSFDEAGRRDDRQTLRGGRRDGRSIGSRICARSKQRSTTFPALASVQSDAASLARGQTVLVRGRDAPILTGPAYAHFKGRSSPSASWKRAPSVRRGCSISADDALCNLPRQKRGQRLAIQTRLWRGVRV